MDFHTQLLGGNDNQDTGRIDISDQRIYGNGDYYCPSKVELGGTWVTFYAQGHGTYNNWCICDGGSSGGAWYASTGGTNGITR